MSFIQFKGAGVDKGEVYISEAAHLVGIHVNREKKALRVYWDTVGAFNLDYAAHIHWADETLLPYANIPKVVG